MNEVFSVIQKHICYFFLKPKLFLKMVFERYKCTVTCTEYLKFFEYNKNQAKFLIFILKFSSEYFKLSSQSTHH